MPKKTDIAKMAPQVGETINAVGFAGTEARYEVERKKKQQETSK